MIATCEAFVLADKLGLDRQKMFDVVASASGASWSMNTYCPAQGVGPTSPADNDYRPGFAAELMVKDLLLAVSAGDLEAEDLARLELPMARRALEVYSDFVENGGGPRAGFLGNDTAVGGVRVLCGGGGGLFFSILLNIQEFYKLRWMDCLHRLLLRVGVKS